VRLLLAQAYLRSAQADKAEALLEPLAQSPAADAATLTALAEAQLQAGDDAARKRLADFASAAPRDGRALLAQARFEQRSGSSDATVMGLLRRAIGADPDLVDAHEALVQNRLAAGDPPAALVAAQDAAARLPDDPAVVSLLGMAQLTAGDAQQAVSTIKRLVAIRPRQVQPLLLLADAQRAAGNRAATSAALDQVLALAPDDARALRAQALMAMDDEKPLDALALARRLQTRRPKEPAGWALEGEMQARAGQWPAAAAAYRVARQRGGWRPGG
jgi:Flp pilus assembly protein TadD